MLPLRDWNEKNHEVNVQCPGVFVSKCGKSKIGWPCKGYRHRQSCWLCNVPMRWKMHRHAWRHMLGRDIPMFLGRLAVREVLFEAMALGWLAWAAFCGCLGVVASYAPLQ
jgi:hypothetical protein